MILRGIKFPPIMNASGAQGFFGEGYPYHRYSKCLGLTFERCGFIAKTTTLHERAGNMLRQRDGITPQEWKPKCIVVKFLSGVVLNAVGLSGPGASALFDDGRWQRRQEPFFLSFMSVKENHIDRLDELKQFVDLLLHHLPTFSTSIGLEINFSCPNAGLDPSNLLAEVYKALDIASELKVPLQCKFNATVPPRAVCDIARHEACDAITMSNTIPWGLLPDAINWRRYFWRRQSPLAQFGGGGLSGPPLLPIVCRWISEARAQGLAKPIWGCGGVDSVSAVRALKDVDADGAQIGTVAIVRPWRMPSIIQTAHELF